MLSRSKTVLFAVILTTASSGLAAEPLSHLASPKGNDGLTRRGFITRSAFAALAASLGLKSESRAEDLATHVPLQMGRLSRAELIRRTSSPEYLAQVEAKIEASFNDPALAEEIALSQSVNQDIRSGKFEILSEDEIGEDHMPVGFLPARARDIIVYEAYQDADYAAGEDQFGALFINGKQVDAFYISAGKGSPASRGHVTPYGSWHPTDLNYFNEAAMIGTVHFKPRFAIHDTPEKFQPLFGHDASHGCLRTERRVVDGFYELARETPWAQITIVIKQKPGADVIHPDGIAPFRLGKYVPSKPLTNWAQVGQAIDHPLNKGALFKSPKGDSI